MDTGSVLAFCQGLLRDLPGKQIWLILDNGPAHISRGFRQFLEKHPRLKVQHQPTYAPWTNPVERLWQELRRAVTHCHDLPDLAEVKQAAQRWCRRLAADPAAARQLASFQGAQTAH